MPNTWSADLEKHYAITLPKDLKAWFDDEIYKQPSGGSYNQPELPADLLNPDSPVVWAGQMMPDTIPLMGNGCGDVLCAKITADGRIGEIIAWDHEGGNWTPYGNTWAEALLLSRMPSSDELDEQDTTNPKGIMGKLVNAFRSRALHNPQEDHYAQWAIGFVPALAAMTIKELFAPHRTANDILKRHGLLEVPFLRERCERASRPRLRAKLETEAVRLQYTQLVQELGRPTTVSWSFDPMLIPAEHRSRVEKITGSSIEGLSAPSWSDAEPVAKQALAIRQDLSWPYAVAGWAAERDGRLAEAIDLYRQGTAALGSSADFTEYWHPTSGRHFKFSLDRLVALRESLPDGLQDDDLIAAAAEGRVPEYWMDQAAKHESAEDWQNAYSCLYRAGWDKLITNYSEEVLGRLAAAASHLSPSLAAVAKHHLDSQKR